MQELSETQELHDCPCGPERAGQDRADQAGGRNIHPGPRSDSDAERYPAGIQPNSGKCQEGSSRTWEAAECTHKLRGG